MRRRPVDMASLVAGIAVTVLGVLFLLDQAGALDLRFGLLWPALLIATGAILLALGLAGPRR
jgi:hypothetical protein